MCGVVGYVGHRECHELLLEGLRCLEYRGYDSAGMACVSDKGIQLAKAVGKVASLAEQVSKGAPSGKTGIAHTRWATHGTVTESNTHPHSDANGKIALVHNGIIENHLALRSYLEGEGIKFQSETDSEVLAQLIGLHYQGNLFEAVHRALEVVDGTYGIIVVAADQPDLLVGARRGSPLVLAIGKNENLLASDVQALVAHSDNVVYLNDGEIVSLSPGEFKIRGMDREIRTPEVERIEIALESLEKGDFPHFMLKEIFEQPESLRRTFSGRLDLAEGTPVLGGIANCAQTMQKARKLVITACGTSWHAGLIGRYVMEEWARLPTEVEYASEFRYRNPILDSRTPVFFISQSGETADTLAALREARLKGAPCLGICNVVGSSIPRSTDAGVYTHAGPEIGVASTKAFTAQVAALTMLAAWVGRMRGLSIGKGKEIIEALTKIPDQIDSITAQSEYFKSIASDIKEAANCLCLGRGLQFPVALEGALKLKEISYIHAEGYPAAEMKHGPIALIEKGMPVIVIAIRDATYDKIGGNIQEIKARGGKVIAIVNEGDKDIASQSDHVIEVPRVMPELAPLLTVIPLQLLAYHLAVLRGCDVDQPRNLAKSVTVE
jgi:glutamine---fructose-6-phosphate transaminase (isomerizing)